MTNIFNNGYLDRVLDRTFDACRVVLQSPLEDSLAIEAVSKKAHLPYELTEKCMRDLALNRVILYKDRRFALARKDAFA